MVFLQFYGTVGVDGPVGYKIAVESFKMPILFKPKLYEYPQDNFGLKIIGKYNWIKMILLILFI